MTNRMTRVTCKLTVAAILIGLTAGLMLPVFNARLGAGARPVAPTAALPALQGEPAIRRLKEVGLYDSLQKAVEATRYEMRWEEQPALRHLPPSYYAPNPAQRLNAYFTSHGLHLAPQRTSRDATDIHRVSDQAEWQAEMKLIGYGYGESPLPVGPAELVAEDNRIEYRRTGLPLVEWYVNKAEGLEQGFTIEAPPGIKPQGERLRLVLEVSGDLRAELAEEGRVIVLKQADGQVALRYSDLHAYDAEGQVLPSEMKINDGRIVLEVEEAGAMYPVTIDPVFNQQQKLTASDGAAYDQFGSSIAISGDTAVVGAVYDDGTGSNSDQGSAYVYLRSGLIWTVQQKLTAGDGGWQDEFGSSVAISGGTVVVGAPGDYEGSAYVFVRNGTTWSQQQKLTASDRAVYDRFGVSVAISGDTVVAGALYDDIDGNYDQGSAYVFVRSGTSWSEQQKLVHSSGQASDEFGSSVAISNETVVVGAPSDSVRCGFLGLGTCIDQGSVSVFVRSGTTWSQQDGRLIASDGEPYDRFGNSVAIDGETLVVGAERADVYAIQSINNGWTHIGLNTDQGAAYVFVRSGTFWSQQQKLTNSGGATVDGAADDRFGYSVAINGDAIVVGAWHDDIGSNVDQGSAYIFARNGTSWSQQRKLIASDGAAGDAYGSSVAISADTIFVGAQADDNGPTIADQGSVYMYAAWGQKQKLTASDGAANDRFGRSVAINGSVAVVGAPWNDSSRGSAYVFVRSGSTWYQVQKLTASDGAVGDGFGISVAISESTVVVGAYGDDIGKNVDQGSAYVFVRRELSNFWSQQAKLIPGSGADWDYFGSSVAVSGDTVVVGTAGNLGSADVFVRSGSSWSHEQKLVANNVACGFGESVAISGDTVVVGSPCDKVGANLKQGSTYVFGRWSTSWSQKYRLTASDGAAGDYFGASVAISGDTVVVGANLDDAGSNANQGSAYVFAGSGTMWSQQQKLTASDGAADDNFGDSVAIDGDTVVVGAPLDDVGSNLTQGSAYVFVRGGTSWSQQQKLTASDGAANDRFGSSVAISGNTVVVGAERADIGSNSDRGSVYVFVGP